jgi:hypothetical protein
MNIISNAITEGQMQNERRKTACNSALKKCGVSASCKRIFSAAESVGACDELRNYL